MSFYVLIFPIMSCEVKKMDENNVKDTPAPLEPDRKKIPTYRLTFKGEGLTIEREVPEATAQQIVNLVLGGGASFKGPDDEDDPREFEQDRQKTPLFRLTLKGEGISIEREVPEATAQQIVSLVLGGPSPRGGPPFEEPEAYDESSEPDDFDDTSFQRRPGQELKDYLREVRDEVAQNLKDVKREVEREIRDSRLPDQEMKDYLREVRDEVAQNLKEVRREVERDIREVRDGVARDIFNMGLGEILGGGKRPRGPARPSRPYDDEEPSSSSPPLSIRKFLRESGAQRNPDKIVAIGAFLRDHLGWESFSRHDIRSQLKNSGARVPRNLTRDLKWALDIGWIEEVPDNRGWYVVTEAGQEALDGRFSSEFRNATKLHTTESPEEEQGSPVETEPDQEESGSEHSEEDGS
jgi:BMFP domain-containing protein YqiC